MTVLAVSAVSAVVAVSVMTATPFNSTPLFRDPDNSQNSLDRGQSRKIRFSKFPGSGLKKM